MAVARRPDFLFGVHQHWRVGAVSPVGLGHTSSDIAVLLYSGGGPNGGTVHCAALASCECYQIGGRLTPTSKLAARGLPSQSGGVTDC